MGLFSNLSFSMEHFFRLTTRSLASRLQVNSHDRPLWRQMQLRMNLSTLQLRSRKPADLTVTDEFFGEKSTIWNDTAWPKKAVKATSTTIFIFFSQCVSLIEKGAWHGNGDVRPKVRMSVQILDESQAQVPNDSLELIPK